MENYLASFIVAGVGIIGGLCWWWFVLRKKKVAPKSGQATPAQVGNPDIENLAYWMAQMVPQDGSLILDDDGTEKPGEYPAVIWTKNRGIIFRNITHPLGQVWQAEPSLPKSGQHYFIKEKDGGGYEPYDPRVVPMVDGESPQHAYLAVFAVKSLVYRVFPYKKSDLESLKTFAGWIMVIVFLVYFAMLVDKAF